MLPTVAYVAYGYAKDRAPYIRGLLFDESEAYVSGLQTLSNLTQILIAIGVAFLDSARDSRRTRATRSKHIAGSDANVPFLNAKSAYERHKIQAIARILRGQLSRCTIDIL